MSRASRRTPRHATRCWRQRRRLVGESLERRDLLAGDLEQFPAASAPFESARGAVMDVARSELRGGSIASAPSADVGEGEADSQGKVVDLVALAKAITQSGAVFYGAIWCTFCNQQKALFEDGMKYLPFVEVTNPDHTLNSIGTANNISQLPTWVFPDQSRATGVLSIESLAQRAGVAIPVGNQPSFGAIPDVTLKAGAPLWLPLDGYDPNGDLLTYSVVSSSPSVVAAEIPQGNRSLKVDVKSWGVMTFELFDNLVPQITNHIADLASSGFYDANATTGQATKIDQVVRSDALTMFRTGDPSGTGIGTSPLGSVDDQFAAALQHTSSGLLSLYKPDGDDSGDSQFMVLGAPARSMDFDAPIFGRLVEGESERAGINETTTGTGDVPTRTISLSTVSVFTDTENRLLKLQAPIGASGQANVTVVVRDGWGHTFQQVIHVTVVPDNSNGGPFLDDVPPLVVGKDQPLNWTAVGHDVENDPIQYEASLIGPGQLSINATTGQFTVTPETDFEGDVFVEIVARAATGSPNDTADPVDSQTVRVSFSPSASAWHNAFWPEDVDDDGLVAPLDALLIINETNSRQLSNSQGKLPLVRPDNLTPPRLIDTDDDGFVVPLDALLVINLLNSDTGGEGEAPLVLPLTSAATPTVGAATAASSTSDYGDGRWRQQVRAWDAALVEWLDDGAGDAVIGRVSPRWRFPRA